MQPMGHVESVAETDVALIRDSLTNSGQFGLIFKRHAGELWRYLACRVEPSVIDDLLSEAFIIAFRTRHRFDASYSDARPWLFGITVNVIHHHRRSEGRRFAMQRRVADATHKGGIELDEADEVLRIVDRQGQAEAVRAILTQIDEKFVDVLLLSAGYQLSYEEIARSLQIPLGTVRSRLSRGRTQLRELIGNSAQSLEGHAPDPRVLEEDPDA